MKLAILIALIFGVNVVFGVSGSVTNEASGKSLIIDCGNNAIQIDSAVYGNNCNNPSDQTANLGLYCNGFPTCTYLITHTIIGDPHGGCSKTYIYDYTCTATQVPDVEYGLVLREASGKSLSIDCGTSEITIESAMYGRNCNVGRTSDETAHLGAACDGKTACSYTVLHGVIGDPAGGCPKEYDYVYSCLDLCPDPCVGISGNTQEIESNYVDIAELQSRVDTLAAAVASLTEIMERRRDARAGGQSVGVYPGDLNFDAFFYKYQPEIIFAFLFVSVMLMVSICCMCNADRKGKSKYSRVRIYDTDREDVGLNRKQ